MFRNDRFRDLREKGQYTHEELADLLGVGYSSIYRWESGKRVPSVDAVVKMAEFFNVSTDYLLGVSDDPSAHVKMDNITPKEKRVLSAMRDGDLAQLLRVLVDDADKAMA